MLKVLKVAGNTYPYKGCKAMYSRHLVSKEAGEMILHIFDRHTLSVIFNRLSIHEKFWKAET